MRKYIICAALLLPSPSFAEQLHNYDQIKSAVTEGRLLRIFVDYTKCVSSSTSFTKVIGNQNAIYTPNAMAITNEGGIISYILYFTMNDGHYPSRPVYQYGKYLISKDNTLVLTFASLNAIDYSPLGPNVRLTCKIDDGFKIFVTH